MLKLTFFAIWGAVFVLNIIAMALISPWAKLRRKYPGSLFATGTTFVRLTSGRFDKFRITNVLMIRGNQQGMRLSLLLFGLIVWPIFIPWHKMRVYYSEIRGIPVARIRFSGSKVELWLRWYLIDIIQTKLEVALPVVTTSLE